MTYLSCVGIQNHQRALALSQGGHHRVAYALSVLFLGHDPVYHHLYEMYLVAVHSGGHVPQLTYLPVYPDRGESLFQQAVEEFTVVAFAAFYKRGQDDALPPVVFFHDEIHDAGVGVSDHRLAGYGRIGRGGPGVEQSEEIRNLCYGAHCGAGIAVGALLLYGDGGAETVDALHLGPLHHTDVVPGVGGQGVHIAPAGLGVDGVEGQ